MGKVLVLKDNLLYVKNNSFIGTNDYVSTTSYALLEAFILFNAYQFSIGKSVGKLGETRLNITLNSSITDEIEKIENFEIEIKKLKDKDKEQDKKRDKLQIQTDPQLYLNPADAQAKLQKIYDYILKASIGCTVLITCAVARIVSGQIQDFCDVQFQLAKGQNENGRVIFWLKYAEDKDGKQPKDTIFDFKFIKENVRVFEQASIIQGKIDWDSVKVPESKASIELKTECKGCV